MTATKAKTNPFETGSEEGDSKESLGDMAASASAEAADDAGSVKTLDGTDYTKVRFVGMSFDSLDTEVKIGDEMTFIVKGRVKGVADEESASGDLRHLAKVKVSSVVLKAE